MKSDAEHAAEHDAVNLAFGARIAFLRAQAGRKRGRYFSQKELGRKVGLSQPQISEIETGYQPGIGRRRDGIPVDKLARFAQALGVTVVELVTGLGYIGEPVIIPGITARATAIGKSGTVTAD